MPQELILALLVAAIALPLLGLFVLSARRPGTYDAATGTLVMRYALALRVVGVLFGIVVPVGVVALIFVFWPQREEDRIAAVCVLLGFTLLGVFLLIESFTFYAVVSNEGLESYSAWRWKRSAAWGDVVSVMSTNPTNYLVFRTRQGVTIRLPLWFTGLRELALFVKDHLHPAAYRGALHALQSLQPLEDW
jgi:hypothetical protein